MQYIADLLLDGDSEFIALMDADTVVFAPDMIPLLFHEGRRPIVGVRPQI